MDILLSKLECLSKPVKMTDNDKDTSLLSNLPIFRTLRICNILWVVLFSCLYATKLFWIVISNLAE
jgi:hypothetical protein